jgi:hypothetical protein
MPHQGAAVPGRPSSWWRHQELRLVALIILPERIEPGCPKSTPRSPIPNSGRRSISSFWPPPSFPAISDRTYTLRVSYPSSQTSPPSLSCSLSTCRWPSFFFAELRRQTMVVPRRPDLHLLVSKGRPNWTQPRPRLASLPIIKSIRDQRLSVCSP